jgi:hypothetical protein
MRLVLTLSLGASVLLSAGAARAEILFQTITQPIATSAFSANSGVDGPLAQSFYNTNPWQMMDLKLSLGDTDPAVGGSVIITLNADDSAIPGSQPGSQIATIATLTDAQVNASDASLLTDISVHDGIWDFSNLNYSLAANTSYWIQVADTNSGGLTNVFWNSVSASATSDAIGAYNQWVYADAGNSQITSLAGVGAFEMQIDAPEPASLAVLGSAVLAIGFARRRFAAGPKTPAADA